ncbi:unnamed protein product [Orchesella dallaii]|uniref:Uncharacterized protein n=1 Tax=Orchesella dallaii TaxID=48710 RepID=A0ABP1PK28_9HEXA
MWKSSDLWSMWPDQRAKVLHKGNDLSSSSDSCPTSRGFVDGPEDFDKMIKPPSPRQVHPVLDKGDIKLGQFHNLHHLLQQNNGNNGNSNHSYILQQPPTGRKKSSTLPASDEGDKTGSQDGCHFIRVNSGRIELVSKDSWKTSSADHSGNNSPYNTAAERFLSRHLKNDVRHSWCGSAVRPQQKNPDVPQQTQTQSKRLSEDPQYGGGGGGFRGGLGSNNNNNRIYPQEDIPSEAGQQHSHTHPHHHNHHQQHQHTHSLPQQQHHQPQSNDVDGESTSASASAASPSPETNNGKGLLSPLRERLAAIEELTTSLQSWQLTEKTEYEKCVSDLANQVSRAVALQQLMKSEVEKLQQRVVDLENHNKAMATMIIPTLMKLHDTVGIKEGPQLKSIEAAPETRMTTSDIEPDSRNLVKSQENHQLFSPSFPHNNDSSSCINGPSHFIAIVATSPPSQNASSQMKTICYESPTCNSSREVTAAVPIVSKEVKEIIVASDLQPPTSSPLTTSSTVVSSTPTPLSSRSSPVKAPRGRVDCRIPRINGSSTGSIPSGSSALSRSNSCNSNSGRYQQSPAVISLIENEPTGTKSEVNEQNQSQIIIVNQNNTSLESSSLSSSVSGGPIIIPNNSEMSNSNISSRNNVSNNISANNNSSTSSRTSLCSGIPRMASPARVATVSKINGGASQSTSSPNPKPRRANHSGNNNSSPQTHNESGTSSPHGGGSKLPVRKAPFNSSVSRHPAATSKSLPANSNIGTAFQSMSQSGPQGNKHSKSTFGFGSKKNGTAIAAKNAKASNKSSSNAPSITNLPECNASGGGGGVSGSNSVSKPIKLGVATSTAATAIGITKASGNGKDEGYSTMSSEALAEQEHTLEKLSQRVNSSNVGSSRGTSFSLKSATASSINGGGSQTTTRSSCNKIIMGSSEVEGATRNSIHKSNTFNTFREMVGGKECSNSAAPPTSRDPDQKKYTCDNNSYETSFRSNTNCSSGTPISHDIIAESYKFNGTTGSSVGVNSTQFTSLPNSTSSSSTYSSKGSKSTAQPQAQQRSQKSNNSSSSNKDRITTTRMMDGNIVRIVRGSPYSIRFGEESGDDMEDEEDPSSSTILWEDSDDSDILFLPLEVSASSAASSHSTLIPPPQSSGESRSYYSSWGASSSATPTTTSGTTSTLEKGSNGSVNMSGVGVVGGLSNGSSNTFSKRAYPLRRTKGEVTVDILLVNNVRSNNSGFGDEGGDDTLIISSNHHDNSNNSKNISSSSKSNNRCYISNNSDNSSSIVVSNGFGAAVGGEGGGHLQLQHATHKLVNNRSSLNGHHHLDHDDPNHTTDEMEERALIEKWMQLEEVRNEQVPGEEWAWDWDGVERTYTRVLRSGMRAANARREAPLMNLGEDVDLDVDLILEEGDLEAISIEEKNALNESESRATGMQIDSSTWTKSKSRKGSSNKEGRKKDETSKDRKSNSPETRSPEKVRETAETVLILLEGEREIENEDGLLIKRARDEDEESCDDVGEDAKRDLKKSPNRPINLDENGMVVTSSCDPCGDGGEADGEEDDPPPVIEFTPEFYRLVNYGSNLSFSDNESSNLTSPNPSATQSPKVSAGGNNNKSGGGGVSNGINNSNAATSPIGSVPGVIQQRSPKKRRHTKRSHSANNATTAIPALPIIPSSVQSKTDDKISQTDFSCSSLENMSSVSSAELSAECRNCLDIIKKLVGHADADDTEGGCSSDCRAESEENGAFDAERRRAEMDGGSFATTWISVPKGLPSTEVSSKKKERSYSLGICICI